MKRVKIFWTGGFDSSFRISQLSKLEIEIEPYYLSDNRRSEKNELKAIEDIMDYLNSLSKTKAKILPLNYIEMSNRDENRKITQSYNTLLEQDFMGSQYEWLGIFAKTHKGVELSIHKDDKAMHLILKHGAIKEEHDPEIGNYWVIDKEKSSNDLIKVFGDYHLPLAKYTKKQMRKEYEENDFEEVMKKTWFCYTPVKGKPCGKCNPCKYTIEEGLKERFDSDALYRYYQRKANDFLKTQSFVKKHAFIKKIMSKTFNFTLMFVKKYLKFKEKL